MGTKIVIRFDKDIEPERLQELLGELHATCSEDIEGHGWSDGGYKITDNMKGIIDKEQRRDLEETLHQERMNLVSEWSGRDMCEEIGYAYEDYVESLSDEALLCEIEEHIVNMNDHGEDTEDLQETVDDIKLNYAVKKEVLGG